MARRPPVIPEIAKAYQNDPRTRLALQALATGSSSDPVAGGKYAWADGIARALQAGMGGYANKKLMGQYGEDEAELIGERRAMGREGLTGLAGAPASNIVPPSAPLAVTDNQAQMAAVPDQAATILQNTPADIMRPPGPPGMPPAPGSVQPTAMGGRPAGQLPFVRRTAATAPNLKAGAEALTSAGARVTSGYRTPEHNADVGGTANSYHTRGTKDNPQAYDFVPPKGMTMAGLELRARKAYPGYDVINEGDHVHVEPRGGAAPTQIAGAESTDTLQGGDAAAPLDPFAVPTPEAIPDEPPEVLRPEAPKSVGATKSPLLRAAYEIMAGGNAYESDRGQRFYESGLEEQGKLNEAAAEREQDLSKLGYQTDLGIFADAAQAKRQHGYALRQAAITGNREDRNAYVDWKRKQLAEREQLATQERMNAADNAARLAEAAGKPLVMPDAVASRLTAQSKVMEDANFLKSAFKDEFVGKLFLGDNAVKINKVIGANPEMAAWWSRYQGLVNEVRHGQFGAALSKYERDEFLKAVATPRTAPNVAKGIIDTQQRIVSKYLGQRGRAIAGKYGRDNVQAALGVDDIDKLGIEEAAAPAATMSDAERLAKYGIK